jgi:hypothetical protein
MIYDAWIYYPPIPSSPLHATSNRPKQGPGFESEMSGDGDVDNNTDTYVCNAGLHCMVHIQPRPPRQTIFIHTDLLRRDKPALQVASFRHVRGESKRGEEQRTFAGSHRLGGDEWQHPSRIWLCISNLAFFSDPYYTPSRAEGKNCHGQHIWHPISKVPHNTFLTFMSKCPSPTPFGFCCRRWHTYALAPSTQNI